MSIYKGHDQKCTRDIVPPHSSHLLLLDQEDPVFDIFQVITLNIRFQCFYNSWKLWVFDVIQPVDLSDCKAIKLVRDFVNEKSLLIKSAVVSSYNVSLL